MGVILNEKELLRLKVTDCVLLVFEYLEDLTNVKGLEKLVMIILKLLLEVVSLPEVVEHCDPTWSKLLQSPSNR